MKKAAIALCGLLVAGYLWAQSATNTGQQVTSWTFTNFPLYGVEVTPADATALARPMAIRADADGAVTATCQGSSTAITLNLVAGEFFPCQVRIVADTGTDAITIHGFY